MSSRAVPSKRWKTFSCLCLLLAGPAVAQTLFTEVTEEAIVGRQTRARSIAFGDYDNDGWPDLFLAEDRAEITRIALYHNAGNGRFADHSMAIQGELTPKVKW